MRYNGRDKHYHDLYRIDVTTGGGTMVYETHEYSGLITDADFRLRLATRVAKATAT